MATKKTSGKQLADMLYGKPDGAAFGVYPQAGKRGQAKPTAQDQVTQLFSDDRAVPLPQFGDNDLSVPTAGNRAMGQRMVERDVDLKRQADRDMSPLEKLAGGMQTGRLMGSGLVQAVKSIPTAVTKGGKAAEEYIAENIYKPTQPKAYEYAQDIGDFLTSLETDYKIPPVLPEALALQGLMGPATRQATRQGALNLAAPRTLNPQAGVFIGPKAKTFNKGKADMAIAMEEAGRTPAEIWQATGTFRGADGILRQEIDDRAAKFLSASDRQERIDATKGKIAEMKERIKPTTQKDLFPKALTEAKKELRDDISILKSDINLREKNPRTQGLMAQHIFEHPELYAAYPELQSSVKIITEGGRGGNARGALSIAPSRGHFPGSMEMDIYDAGLRGNPTSTALHEMQHAVQTIEGMGPGGNPTFAFANPEAHDILKRLREDVYKPSSFEDFQRVNKFPEDEAQAAYEQYVKERKANPITSDKIERSMQETAAMEYYKRLLGEAEARAVQDRQMMTPAQRMEYPPPTSYDVPQEDLIVKPPREYAEGGRVHFSDNPDVMQLELAGGGAVRMQAGGLAKAAKALKAAKTQVPIKFPVARGPSVDEIRAMAERMAPQVTGEFVRAAPTKSKPNPSENVVGKSRQQFDREKNLQIGYQNIKPPVTPSEFDYAKHKDELLIGASGDVTPGNRMLVSIDNQPLSEPVHLQAGPEWGLYNPSAWAATDEMAKTWMKRADMAADEYNAKPHLHYHKMTPDANWYAMHHLHSLLGHMRPEELMIKNPELYAKMVDEIRTKDVGFGKHPEFVGFEDPLILSIHTQVDPNLRRHLGKILGQPTFSERYGLRSGQDVMAATSLPELRDLEVGSSGYAVVPLDTKAPLQHFAADSQTYDTGFPMAGPVERSKYPIPYQLVYRDTLDWMEKNPSEGKSSEFGRMSMIVPKQQIDDELIDAIGEYQLRMKALTGKKAGGAVRKAAGGEITADDLILEERKL